MIPLLTGVRVVDITSIVLGPLASQILADLGAEVIKVEPVEGELSRTVHPVGAPGLSAMFLNNNRNKRSLAVDLKSPAGKEILGKLVATSDVLMHNMRVDAITRLGFGFAQAKALNPRIIYCSAIGFGQDGRYRDRPAFDDVIQAASGLAMLPAHVGGDPAYVPSVVADKVAALYAAYGVLAAIAAQARGRVEAVEVEVPMFESLVGFLLNEHLSAATFAPEAAGAGYHRLFSRNRRPYRTKDGWVAVLPYTGEQWRRILVEIGRDDVVAMPWFADAGERSRRIDELYGILSAGVAERTTADWLDTFARLDIPYSKVNDLDDLLNDPHLADVGFFAPGGQDAAGATRALRQPVVFRGAGAQPDRRAPDVGADSRSVLAGLGLSEADVRHLEAAGVIRCGTENDHA
ncbi:CaiB/BaiF CoA transferase family protein [Azospirillum sp. ST 5-10]|uniref:CaiB/BaiF CoA transferase family protein n=1 Tax=unclassified Azospirillum TaxID=2630922 RepID=UPI003F4A3ABE